MSETFQRMDKSFIQEPKELNNLKNQDNLIHKYLPEQRDIDKILMNQIILVYKVIQFLWLLDK